MTLKEVMGEKVKVNNRLDMDNSERIKNVLLGYSIQADRLVIYMKSLVTADDPDKQAKANKATELMKTIQRELLWIAALQPDYEKNLKNDLWNMSKKSLWCMRKLKKTVKTLEGVIEDTDGLIRGKAA